MGSGCDANWGKSAILFAYANIGSAIFVKACFCWGYGVARCSSARAAIYKEAVGADNN
jgi:hypothetical protein